MPLPISLDDLVLKLFRNGEDGRIKITNSEVVYLLTFRHLFFNVCTESDYLRTDKSFGKVA
jgi:hypothetical protein